MPVMKGLEILHEEALSFVERRWANLDDLRIKIQQRLVEVTPKPDGLDALEFPGFQVALLDGGLQFLQFGYDLLPRPVDQDAIVAFVWRLLDAKKVRIVT